MDIYNQRLKSRTITQTKPAEKHNGSQSLYSIYHGLRNGQYTGQGYHAATLPLPFFRNLSGRYNGIPQMIDVLRTTKDTKERSAVMAILYRHVIDSADSDLSTTTTLSGWSWTPQLDLRAETRELQAHYPRMNNREAFILFGGVQQVVRVLIQLAETIRHQNTSEMFRILKLKIRPYTTELNVFVSNAVSILRVCCKSKDIAGSLAANDTLLEALFLLIGEDLVFSKAIYLIEDIIVERVTVLDLSTLHDFAPMISRLALRQLAFFCRILVLVVFDHTETSSHKQDAVLSNTPDRLSLKKRTELYLNHQIIVKNHALLINIPGFISRLVNALGKEDIFMQDADQLEETIIDNDENDSDVNDGAIYSNNEDSENQSHHESTNGDVSISVTHILGHLNHLLHEVDEDIGVVLPDANRVNLNASQLYDIIKYNKVLWEQYNNIYYTRNESDKEVQLLMENEINDNIKDDLDKDIDGFNWRERKEDGEYDWLPTASKIEQAIDNVLFRLMIIRDRGLNQIRTRRHSEMIRDSQALSTLTFAFYRMEVLFVVSSLLSSSWKTTVQMQVAEAGLVNILQSMLDKFSWGVTVSDTDKCMRIPLHGVHCDCEPEGTSKIQFLRLIHRCCDNKDYRYKRLLLSQHDIARMKLIAADFGLPERLEFEFDNITNNHYQPMGEGLLMKLINVLINEPRESTFRYWLTSCIESYLRDSPVIDRLFVLETPLLPHLLSVIAAQPVNFTCLQGAFDLLGELLKFNPIAFLGLDELPTDSEFDLFLAIAHSNLVESNVFLRAAVLSLNQFQYLPYTSDHPCHVTPPDTLKLISRQLKEIELSQHIIKPILNPLGVTVLEQIQRTRLHRFMTMLPNRIALISKLMGVLSLDAITNGNICILNTTLIFLVLEKRTGHLSAVLKGILDTEGPIRLQQFKQLGHFWYQYFKERPQELLILEQTTHILVSDWWNIVALLLGDSCESLDFFINSVKSPFLHYTL